MSADEDRAQARVIVRGHVQGVYFRGTLKQQADRRGVNGWVRNRPDGSVEALLQGRRDQVAAVAAWMGVGPRGARVDSTDVKWSEIADALQRFEVVG